MICRLSEAGVCEAAEPPSIHSIVFWVATNTIHATDETAHATSTEWRDDDKNLLVVEELNRAYARLPFSREYEGVQDHCPFAISWETGPNVPVAWKGGVAGVFGDEIALVSGLWMPGRKNLAYSYYIKTRSLRLAIFSSGTCSPAPGTRRYCTRAVPRPGWHLNFIGQISMKA